MLDCPALPELTTGDLEARFYLAIAIIDLYGDCRKKHANLKAWIEHYQQLYE